MTLLCPNPIEAYQGVWVVAELNDAGLVTDTSLESFTAAKKLTASCGQAIHAVLLSSVATDTTQAEATLAHFGADHVYSLKHDALGACHSQAISEALSSLILDKKPSVVILPSSALTRDFAPRVAAKVGGGLAPDALDVSCDGNCAITVTRPTYGENMRATVTFQNARPQMITNRAKAFAKGEADTSRAVSSETITPDLSGVDLGRIKLISISKAENKGGKKLEESEIIVSGGRGLKGPEHFALVEELAEALGGAVGATRAVVDAGWRPHSEQVGQTGKTVSPQLYFALGISGAIQHQVGMSSSKLIMAVNKDENAPIFEVADFGIVGDVFEVVPRLTKAIKEQNLTPSV